MITSLNKIKTCKNTFGQVYENDNVTHAEALKFTQSQAWDDMIEDVRERTGVEVRRWKNNCNCIFVYLQSFEIFMGQLMYANTTWMLCIQYPSDDPWTDWIGSQDVQVPASLGTRKVRFFKQLKISVWKFDGPHFFRYTDFISRTADFPPWCNIFSKKDTTLFEFDFDLEAFYESGPAFEITTMATHKVIKDLYGLIDSHTSAGQTPEASAVFTFGHSGGLGPLINAFEIYRDDFNLTVWNIYISLNPSEYPI